MRNHLSAAPLLFTALLCCAAPTSAQNLPNPFFVTTPPGAAGIIAVDLDKNNVKDFAFVNSSHNSVSVFFTIGASSGGSGGTNPWSPLNVYSSGGQAPIAVVAGDWNKDTNVDLIVAHAGSLDAVVLQSTGFGGASGFNPSTVIPLGVIPTSLAVADVDFDTNLDLLVGHAGGLNVLYGGPAPRPTLSIPFAAPVANAAVASSSVAGVGLLVAASTSTGTLTLLKSDGLGGLTTSVNALPVNGGLRTLLFEDLNRDGHADVVVERASDLALLSGDSLGNLGAAVSLPLPAGFMPYGISAIDANGDLWPELVVAASNSQLHVLRGGPTGFTAGFSEPLPGPNTSIATFSYNNASYFLVLEPQTNQAFGARFQLPSGVTVSLQSSPSGLQLQADGQTVVAPTSSTRPAGSTFTLDAPTPQLVGPGLRYIFASWSQGGPKSQTLTVPLANVTYTATFQPQAQVSTTVSPAGAGSILLSPASPDGFYAVGTAVSASATANACYLAAGISPASVVTVTAPTTITANFVPSVASNVSGQVTVYRSGLIFNRATNQFQGTVTIRNNGAPLTNVRLVIENVASGFSWFNFDALTQCVTPVGTKYKVAAASLAPGASVTIPVIFTRTTSTALNYTTRVLAGAGMP